MRRRDDRGVGSHGGRPRLDIRRVVGKGKGSRSEIGVANTELIISLVVDSGAVAQNWGTVSRGRGWNSKSLPSDDSGLLAAYTKGSGLFKPLHA